MYKTGRVSLTKRRVRFKTPTAAGAPWVVCFAMVVIQALLNQCITKEEFQLSRTPDASYRVRHIWDHKVIDERPSYWKDPQQKQQPKQSLPFTMPDNATHRENQSQMLHRRRMCENLSALKRSATLGEGGGAQVSSYGLCRVRSRSRLCVGMAREFYICHSPAPKIKLVCRRRVGLRRPSAPIRT